MQSTAVTLQRKLSIGKRKEHRHVFSLDLNVDSVFDDVTSVMQLPEKHDHQ